MRLLIVGYNFLPYGCDQDFLLPPDARDWLPDGHLSWAVTGAVDELDLGAFLAYHPQRREGPPGLPPEDDDGAGAVLLLHGDPVVEGR